MHSGTRSMPLFAFFAVSLVLLAVLSAVHLTQGTASLGLSDLFSSLTGHGGEQQNAVVLTSRIPRLLTGLLVGLALGIAGAAMQSASNNVLASPDTLAVNAGAFLAVALLAVLGLSLPLLLSSSVAFVGGLAAALLVLLLSGTGSNNASGPMRLVLAGSALALGLGSVTSALILLFSQETTGLIAWGNGSIAQGSMSKLLQLSPVVVVAVAVIWASSRRLDLLGLGDDASRLAGADPRHARLVAIIGSVLLSAVAVSLAGPIGFVGLCAPAIARLISSKLPGLGRHRALVPASGILGAIVVVGADVLVRVVIGAKAGVEVPTGVVTTLFGAVFLVVLSLRLKDSSLAGGGDVLSRIRSAKTFRIVLLALVAVLVALMISGALLGDAKLLLGDLQNWLAGHSGRTVSAILDTRLPRVLTALLAGGALAVAGGLIQTVSRNALAEPGLLGVSSGGGLAAIIVLTAAPLASAWAVTGAALVGSLVVAIFVFGLAMKGGLQQSRLVLIGIGTSAGLGALTAILLVTTDPYSQTKALTWLSGSTYGRSFSSVAPVLIALAIAVPVLLWMHRDLDLLALDDDSPRVLGVQLVPSRLWALGISVALTAGAVSTVGVIAFVGLVAPHAARSLVGTRHSRFLPVALLIGACTVSLADTIGRTVIAPAQIPAGIMTALVGAPYFLYLLWRSRAALKA